MRWLIKLVVVVSVVTALPQFASAQGTGSDVSVERLMREVQKRREYFCLSQHNWPDRTCCLTAGGTVEQDPGPYPPDGFYKYATMTDEEKNALVDSIQTAIDGLVSSQSFLTPAGRKLEGASYDVTKVHRYRFEMMAIGDGITNSDRNLILGLMWQGIRDLDWTALNPQLQSQQFDANGNGIASDGVHTVKPTACSDCTCYFADTQEAYDDLRSKIDAGWTTALTSDYPQMSESVTYGPTLIPCVPDDGFGYDGGSFWAVKNGFKREFFCDTKGIARLYLRVTEPERGSNDEYEPPVTGNERFHIFQTKTNIDITASSGSPSTIIFNPAGYEPAASWDTVIAPPGADPCWDPGPYTLPCDIGWEVVNSSTIHALSAKDGGADGIAGTMHHDYGAKAPSTPTDCEEECDPEPLPIEVAAGPDTDGPGGVSGPGGTGDDGPDDGDCESEGEAGDGETSNSISLASGHKIERSTDVVVALPGQDFQLIREYTSQPELYGSSGNPWGGLVGVNWSMNVFQRLHGDVSGSGTKYVVWWTKGMRAVRFILTSGEWLPKGPTSQGITDETLDIDGTSYRVWRMQSPGKWDIDFYRETSGVSGFADVDTDLAGRIAQVRDAWGNVHHYEYEPFTAVGGTGTAYRLSQILLHATPSTIDDAAAVVNFEWHIREDGDGYEAAHGRLASVSVLRPSTIDFEGTPTAWWTVTQAVRYFYYDEGGVPVPEPLSVGSGDSTMVTLADLGTDGDLIQVIKETALDRGLQMRETADLGDPYTYNHRKIWQYRYHDGVTRWSAPGVPAASFGEEHQLRMVISPEQIEEVYRRLTAETTPATELEQAASEIMENEDESAIHTLSINPLDIATKLIGYNNGDSRVKTQWLLAGCGCSGVGQGKKLNFSYLTWTDGGTNGKSVHVTEQRWDDTLMTPTFVDHRDQFYDLIEIDGVDYLRVKAIKDVRSVAPGPGESTGRTWVWEYTRDGTDANLVQIVTPAAAAMATTSYVAAFGSSAPVWPSGISGGKVLGFAYNSNNRLTERRISDGVESSISQMDLLWRAEYLTPARIDLPTSIERFRTSTTTGSVSDDDIEEVEYQYGYHDTNSLYIASVSMVQERELVSENGPGTPTTVSSTELFSSTGLNEWSRVADDSLTRRVFDSSSGRMTSITRNADVVDLDASDFGNVTTTGWGQSGDRLTTAYTRDLLGRIIATERPGGVKSYVRRVMLPGDLGLDVAKFATAGVELFNGVDLYAEIVLPQDLESTAHHPAWEREEAGGRFTGSASVTWRNAAGKVVRSGEFYVDELDIYDPAEDLYALHFRSPTASAPGELARSIREIDLQGFVTKKHVWHQIETSITPSASDFYSTTFDYDALGRLTSVTDPTGSVSATTHYDVLDRPLSQAIGTSAGLHTVEEMYYDSAEEMSLDDQGIGNGTVTLVRRFPGEGHPRDLIREYDYRERPTVTRAYANATHLPPHQLVVYDNLDRVTERGLFTSVQTVMSTTDRVSHELMHYSQRGLLYRSQKAVDPTAGSPTYLESHEWFDGVGRSIASLGPNSPATKVVYDALSRPTTVYVSDRGGDAAPGTSGSWDDAAALTSDQVIEQVEYAYNDFGSTASVTSRQRPHDAGTSTGALTGSTSISSYVFMQHDDAGRQIATVDLGTSASSGLFEETTTAPSTPVSAFDSEGEPATIADALVSRVYYDRRGLLGQTVSPDLTYTQFVYDAMRRRIATIENYAEVQPTEIEWDTDRWSVSVIGTGGLSAADTDQDRVTSFVYDGASQLTRRVAHFVDDSGSPVEGVQETRYEYAATKPGMPGATDSLIDSNRLLTKVQYPNESTGAPGSTGYQVFYAYNALGELRAYTDQNGTVHEYTRDDLGRVTADSVTNIPTGIDDDIERIEVAYDSAGRVDKVTSREDDTGGTVVNEVQFTYTPLWQIDQVKQSFDGTIGSGTVRTVDYSYSNLGVSVGNASRLTSTVYPSTTSLLTQYGLTTSINHRVSRPESMIYTPANASTEVEYDLVEYDYIGMGRVAITDYTGIDIQLDRTATQDGDRTSGVYPGWDRWGRVILHQWVDGDFEPHGTATGFPDRPQIFAESYGYDDDSNRIFKHDVRNGVSHAGKSWSFLYDGLDRLQEAVKGDWDGSFTAVAGGQAWDLDVLGNWDTYTEDTAGVFGEFDGSDTTEDRDHNLANEITDSDASPSIPFEYDAAGNTTEYPASIGNSQAKYQLKYDAWNRLVQVKIVEDLGGTPTTTTLVEQEYNGLHWRTVVRRDTDVPVDGIDQMRVLSYDASWRLVEEQVEDGWTTGFTADRTLEQFWGLRYIDDPILRRDDPEAVGGYWHVTDVQFSTMALLDNNADVYERVWYTPYGEARHHWGQDYDGDRAFTTGDATALLNKISGGDVPITDTTNYDVEMDYNRDGVIDFDDYPSGSAQTAVPLGQIGEMASANTSSPDNVIGYAGYVWEGASSLYQVRFRSYSPALGRWMQRDPAGYVDGSNLYQYLASMPLVSLDPSGLGPCETCRNGFDCPYYYTISGGRILVDEHATLECMQSVNAANRAVARALQQLENLADQGCYELFLDGSPAIIDYLDDFAVSVLLDQIKSQPLNASSFGAGWLAAAARAGGRDRLAKLLEPAGKAIGAAVIILPTMEAYQEYVENGWCAAAGPGSQGVIGLATWGFGMRAGLGFLASTGVGVGAAVVVAGFDVYADHQLDKLVDEAESVDSMCDCQSMLASALHQISEARDAFETARSTCSPTAGGRDLFASRARNPNHLSPGPRPINR